MDHKDWDTYIIPPNFIEGGTLLGGMFKVRNVIEAVILAAIVAVPILQLSVSLTARIIMLCFTALPLALIALIGIAGGSLSSFAILLVIFLRSRRILTDAPVQQEQSIGSRLRLPFLKKANLSSSSPEPEPVPKSARRIHVNFRERKVEEHKIFLPKEDVVEPLNQIANYIPIEKVAHGVIYTRDHRYVKVVEVIPVNFLLRSAREQRNIIYSFVSYLKIAPAKVQFKVLTRRADINRHIETVRRELSQESDARCRALQEDYLRLIDQLGSREAITRRFFLAFEYEPHPGTKRGQEEEDAIASLQTAARTAANYLRQCGNEVLLPDDEDKATSEILYNILCRKVCSRHPFSEKVQEVLAEYVAAGRDLDQIPSNEFYAPERIDFTHSRYICIDGLYYTFLLVPSDGYKTQVPAGWLSLLVNAGDGIDLDVFLARQPKERMVRKLG